MAANCQPLSTGYCDSSQSSRSPNDTYDGSHNDNADDFPLQELHPKPSKPEHRSLLVPASDRRRHIKQYIQSLAKSNEERPPWAPGVWTRLPVAGLAALLAVALRMSRHLILFFSCD
jgi:hypothetical protein